MIGWSMILVFCCIVAILLLIGRGGMLNLLFPIIATLIGAFLFATNRQLFIGSVWWLWFLTSGVRRIADFQAGWNPINPLMLAPLLASGISLISALQRTYTLGLSGLFGLVAILLALAYGTIVGDRRRGDRLHQLRDEK
jgi:hypothetical protein